MESTFGTAHQAGSTGSALAQLGVAEIGQITWAVLLIALAAIVGFVGLGVYRARQNAVGDSRYQELIERATAADGRVAEGAQATVAELRGVRTDLGAVRDELVEVKQRLAELERLLSQIG